MADRNAVDFFLSGVNEPVALEIPLNTNHREYISEIKKALQDAGIQVGGVENGGVEVTYNASSNTTPIGILTPVLHPNDLHALYDLIYATLEPIGIRPEYPYVRDIKHLPKKKLSSGVDISDVAEEMIETAIASGIATGEYKAMKAGGSVLNNFVEKLKQTGHLFSGSTISDPYTVASDYVSRDTRMASTDVLYALTYANGMKQYSGHEQRANRGVRFGFLYEYERSSDQPLFYNTGIERGSTAGYVGDRDETPVNRFTNPCVGRWFVWFDEKSQIYNVYKIPENDEHWERMLASLETVMHSGVPQYNWIDKLDKSDKQPVSLINGVEPGKLQQYTDDIKQQNAQRAKDKEQLVAEINKEIDGIKQEIDKLNKKIAEYVQLDNAKTVYASGDYQQRKQAKDELSQKLVQMQTKQAEIQSVFDAIQLRYDALVQRAGDVEQKKMTLLTSTIANARNQVNECATRVDSVTRNLGDIDKNIMAFIKNNYAELSSDDIRSLSPEQRKTIFESVRQDMIMSNDALRVAIKVYMCAPTSERSEYFAEFDKYVARNPKKYTEKLKRVLEGTPNVPDEIKELSRGKSLFVNHIERARKKMLLLQAQQRVEDKQNTEQINVAVEIEKE